MGDPAAAAAAERRELAVAVVSCVAGAALVLLAGGREWVRFSVLVPPLPSVHAVATGHRLVGAETSLGLVVLAAAVALIATRRLGRQLAGGVVALVGVITILVSLHVALDPRSAIGGSGGPLATATGRRGVAATTVDVSAWPWLAAAGGLLAVLVGVLALLRGRRWPAMGRRYDAATANARVASAAARDETSMWDALDRGDDPTA